MMNVNNGILIPESETNCKKEEEKKKFQVPLK